jgi:hypothetical protein
MQAMFCCRPVHAISGPGPQQLIGLPRMHTFDGPGPSTNSDDPLIRSAYGRIMKVRREVVKKRNKKQ